MYYCNNLTKGVTPLLDWDHINQVGTASGAAAPRSVRGSSGRYALSIWLSVRFFPFSETTPHRLGVLRAFVVIESLVKDFDQVKPARRGGLLPLGITAVAEPALDRGEVVPALGDADDRPCEHADHAIEKSLSLKGQGY